METPNKRPCGAVATPRAKLCGAIPHQIAGATPAQFTVIPPRLSYWLNNVDGICVTAEEAFAKAAASVMLGQAELFIDDQTVLAWATAHGVVNGANILQVLQWMQHDGFHQNGGVYGDGAPSSIDFTNAGILNNAITKGPVKIGVAASQLQGAVGTSNGWFGTGFRADQNLDHCVSLCGFGPMSWLAQQLGVSLPSGIDGSKLGYHLFTWNTIGVIDQASMVNITGEAWLRNPTTVMPGPSPSPDPTPIPSPTPSPGPGPGVMFNLVIRTQKHYGQQVSFAVPIPVLPAGHYQVSRAAHAEVE